MYAGTYHIPTETLGIQFYTSSFGWGVVSTSKAAPNTTPFGVFCCIIGLFFHNHGQVKLRNVMTKESSPAKDFAPSKLSFDDIRSQIGFLQGKVLTTLEAAMPQGRQLEATKELIKSAFNQQLDWISALCYKELPVKCCDEIRSMGIDPEQVVKEAGVEIVEDKD
jgi:hypothetical protein